MTVTATNGKPPRKQLADQIDLFERQLDQKCARLDNIIDGLADGLPAAVAEACREGAGLALKDALIEVLTNPELRALLAQTAAAPVPPAPAAPPAPPPSAPPGPSAWTRLKAGLAAARAAVVAAPRKVAVAVTSPFRAALDTLAALNQAAGAALDARRVLWISAGVGLAVGVLCLVMPQWTASAVGAVGAALTTAAVQVGVWAKRIVGCLGLTK
jgi:hypothetical protein